MATKASTTPAIERLIINNHKDNISLGERMTYSPKHHLDIYNHICINNIKLRHHVICRLCFQEKHQIRIFGKKSINGMDKFLYIIYLFICFIDIYIHT